MRWIQACIRPCFRKTLLSPKKPEFIYKYLLSENVIFDTKTKNTHPSNKEIKCIDAFTTDANIEETTLKTSISAANY